MARQRGRSWVWLNAAITGPTFVFDVTLAHGALCSDAPPVTD
jgi:hypothetical protein